MYIYLGDCSVHVIANIYVCNFVCVLRLYLDLVRGPVWGFLRDWGLMKEESRERDSRRDIFANFEE